MKTPVATCAICDEPILMDISQFSDAFDEARLRREFEALAEKHLLSHPQPLVERFWVRRYLDDIPAKDRALALKTIYTELESISGDQDSRGVYTIDEVLGMTSLYRLWLSADGCSYAACQHAERARHVEEVNAVDGKHRALLRRVLSPADWKGSLREWHELAAAVANNCTCPTDTAESIHCAAHQLMAQPTCSNRLLFGRRIAQRLANEEFRPDVH